MKKPHRFEKMFPDRKKVDTGDAVEQAFRDGVDDVQEMDLMDAVEKMSDKIRALPPEEVSNYIATKMARITLIIRGRIPTPPAIGLLENLPKEQRATAVWVTLGGVLGRLYENKVINDIEHTIAVYAMCTLNDPDRAVELIWHTGKAKEKETE